MALEVGDQKQFFIDWRWVQGGWISFDPQKGHESGVPCGVPSGVKIVAERAKKSRPWLKADKPWELVVHAYLSVIYEDGKYRLWYETLHPGGKDGWNSLCYAESNNGYDWEKPKLGFAKFRGEKGNSSSDNNIVYNDTTNGGRPYSGGTVFKDPSCAPEERYKLIYLTWTGGVGDDLLSGRPQVVGAVSPDGIHWTAIEKPFLDGYLSDTQTTAYYDTRLNCYVGYFRYWSGGSWWVSEALWEGSQSWRRQIGRAVSQDFRNWSKPEPVLALGVNDHPAHDLYTNAHTLYEGVHFMFPAQYDREKDTIEVYLATSWDGVRWEYFGQYPVIPLGEPGSGEEGQVYAGCGLVPLGDKIALPYFGSRYTHNQYDPYALEAAGVKRDYSLFAWAIWDKDRLVAIEAEGEGKFTIPPLIHQGKRLVLNVITGAAGEVRVQLRDRNGDVIEGRAFTDCDPIRGDRPEAIVSWRGDSDISATSNRPIQVDVYMRVAKLYTFRFAR